MSRNVEVREVALVEVPVTDRCVILYERARVLTDVKMREEEEEKDRYEGRNTWDNSGERSTSPSSLLLTIMHS